MIHIKYIILAILIFAELFFILTGDTQDSVFVFGTLCAYLMFLYAGFEDE